MKKKLTSAQSNLLKALVPNKKLIVKPKFNNCTTGLFGYIDKEEICREATWRSLLCFDCIKAIDNFKFVITTKGILALKENIFTVASKS